MTGLNPDSKELKKVQKRISDTMRDLTDEQENYQNLINAIQDASAVDVQLMSNSASSSRRRRGRRDAGNMNRRVEELQTQLSAKEVAIGRLWNKLAELQEKERELTAQGY